MSKKQFDLLVIGEINPDLILSGENVVPAFGQAETLVEAATLTIGSSSAIMACGAARLGLKVAFVGIVGDDQFGHFMLDKMAERGLDIAGCVVDPTLTTGLSVILSRPDDRAILTYPGAIPALCLDHIDQSLLAQTRHLHLGSYFLLDALRPDLPVLFAQVQQLGVTTSLDTNWDPGDGWEVSDMLPHCDLFLPNEEEVLRISGCDTFEEALTSLAGQIPAIAVKLGARGGLVRWGDTTVTAPALAVEVVDTTGAGDSFDAGFLYGYLNGLTPLESLHLANVCGSLSTRAAGGTDAQPTLEEAFSQLAI